MSELKEGYPDCIRHEGPQPESYKTFEEWVMARKLWFFNKMIAQNEEQKKRDATYWHE